VDSGSRGVTLPTSVLILKGKIAGAQGKYVNPQATSEIIMVRPFIIDAPYTVRSLLPVI
jgi:hypothetical protein